MSEDIRLSQQVANKSNENQVAVVKKGLTIMDTIKIMLEKEFDGKFDETFFVTLYIRKGNDVNTLGATQLVLGGYTTPTDSALIKFFSTNQATGGDIVDSDSEDLDI